MGRELGMLGPVARRNLFQDSGVKHDDFCNTGWTSLDIVDFSAVNKESISFFQLIDSIIQRNCNLSFFYIQQFTFHVPVGKIVEVFISSCPYAVPAFVFPEFKISQHKKIPAFLKICRSLQKGQKRMP